MSRVAEVLQAITRHELERRPYCELALVTSSFEDADGADSHTVSITLKDSGLAIPRVPVASGVTGAAALPRQGDVVVVLFPRGDLSSAVVMGQVYSEARRPPVFKRDEVALVWPGDTDDAEATGVELRVLADGSERSCSITLGGDKNAVVTVSDGAIQLTAGGVQVALSHSSDSDGAVTISAGGTKMELSQDGDLVIEAAGTLKLKGASVEIDGDTEVKVKGQTVGIN